MTESAGPAGPLPSGAPAQPNQPNLNEKPSASVFKPVLVKLLMVAGIFGLLQIPLFMILGTIEERQNYNVDYPQEYNGPGAGKQSVMGPMLTVPYHYKLTEEREVAPAPAALAATTGDVGVPDNPPPRKTIKVTRTATGYLHFFPENLSVSGNLMPEIRDGGKFKNIVYSTALDFKGTFKTSDFERKKLDEKEIMWQDAFIALGISDLRGISRETTVDWSGKQYKFVPGVNGVKSFDQGQYALLPDVKKDGTYPFSFTLHLMGSRDLNIFPAGKENAINLASTWSQPTFIGGFLPTKKTVSRKGFSSLWEVSYFTRNMAQVWTDTEVDIKNSMDQYMVGVTLATPVEFYQSAIRAVKYGSLFIIMTFLALFSFEMMTKVKIHEFQYLMVGLALSLFFLLLIAASEWIPFVWSYVIAGISTIVQITWYTQAFSKARSAQLWKVMAGTLTTLYVYLYILLQLENFSLVVGAIGLFLTLTLVLYATRNINWYGSATPSGEPTGLPKEAPSPA